MPALWLIRISGSLLHTGGRRAAACVRAAAVRGQRKQWIVMASVAIALAVVACG